MGVRRLEPGRDYFDGLGEGECAGEGDGVWTPLARALLTEGMFGTDTGVAPWLVK